MRVVRRQDGKRRDAARPTLAGADQQQVSLQLQLQPQLPQRPQFPQFPPQLPQVFPPPQQQHTSTRSRMIHRQELFPLFDHISVTSL